MAGLLSEPSDPRLPLDIERAVFECAAVLYPTSIPICMLVAVRVKEWYDAVSVSFMSHEVPPGRLEPILYRVLYCCTAPTDVDTINGFRIIPMDVLLELIRTKPPHFFRRTVRHLFLADGTSFQTESILAACNHVTNLFEYFTPNPHPHTFDALQHLRRLTIGFSYLLKRFPLDIDPPPLAVFATLTHLEVMDTEWDLAELGHRLPLMSNLTHLALNSFLNDSELYDTLRSQTNLQCIVGLVQRPITTTEIHPFADDDRFVCIHQVTSYRMDWIIGAHTGYDYWAIADAFIAARRASKVDGARGPLFPHIITKYYVDFQRHGTSSPI
jgi:hypothetical protein